MKILSTGKTDKGLRRENNEDSYIILPNQIYCSVADGMGGAAAGEVASGIFVSVVEELFSRLNPESEDDVSSMVRTAFLQGNAQIIRSATDNPENAGMGCTAELIAFYEDKYMVGHIGDSRSYLFRDGELRQITRDHSLVQHQIDQGLIPASAAWNHPMKNVVLRAVGIDKELALDITRGRVVLNDIFLLCSDGLSDMLHDAEICRLLAMNGSLEAKATTLIQGALAAGGKDNVTVVLCQAIESPAVL